MWLRFIGLFIKLCVGLRWKQLRFNLRKRLRLRFVLRKRKKLLRIKLLCHAKKIAVIADWKYHHAEVKASKKLRNQKTTISTSRG